MKRYKSIFFPYFVAYTSLNRVGLFDGVHNKIIKAMSRIIKSLAAGALLAVAVGCSQNVGGYLGAIGKPGEVMLVMDHEYLDTPVGHKLVRMLEQPAPALNQEEPSLTVSRVSTEGFKGSLNMVRNELLVSIDPERYSTTSLKYSYDEWAKGQIVVSLQSPSADSLSAYLDRNEEALMNMFMRHELYRFAQTTVDKPSQRVRQLVDSVFGLTIDAPIDIRASSVKKDFLWMSNAQTRGRHDLLVYSFPYSGSDIDISLDRLYAVRDSVLQANIPGGIEGSHPATFRGGLQYRKVQFDGQTRGELRGLWEMTGGAMMGGPFVQHAYIDEEKGRVIVAEGFVYHPNQDKRDMVRLMEASLYTLRPSAKATFDPRVILTTKYTKSF